MIKKKFFFPLFSRHWHITPGGDSFQPLIRPNFIGGGFAYTFTKWLTLHMWKYFWIKWEKFARHCPRILSLSRTLKKRRKKKCHFCPTIVLSSPKEWRNIFLSTKTKRSSSSLENKRAPRRHFYLTTRQKFFSSFYFLTHHSLTPIFIHSFIHSNKLSFVSKSKNKK